MAIKLKAIAFAIAAFSCSSYAENNQSVSDTHVKNDGKGWFWYNEEKLPDITEIIQNPQKQLDPDVLNQLPKDSPKPLSAKWLRENHQKYLDAAMDNPQDQQAMKNYLYLEKYMLNKADEFGYARMSAIYGDPYLDAVASRPTAEFGMRAMNQAAAKHQTAILKELGAQTGIFFFFRSDDAMSQAQAPLVEILASKYGFTIKAISMDRQGLSGTPYASDYLTDQGQAAQLNVLRVPALYLADRERNIDVIVQGLDSLNNLEIRIIDAAKRMGLLTQEVQNMTRPSNLYQTPKGEVGGQIKPQSNFNTDIE